MDNGQAAMGLLAPLPKGRRKMKGEQPTSAPHGDRYLTDGASLFRVAGTLIDTDDDARLELEDCLALELILLPAARVEGLGLHPVALSR